MAEHIRLTVFGASHASEVGVTVEGLPEGERIDLDRLRAFLARRAPGRDELSTSRFEPDEPEFRSGLRDGVTDGAPLTAVIRNTDIRSRDYAAFRRVPRPGHADFAAWAKYGDRWDNAGGGQFSGRMTAPLCVAGGICLQLLEKEGVTVRARAVEIGGETDPASMEAAIRAAKADGDSVGGVVECVVEGLPAGVGAPLFDGLESRIARLVFGIPAVKGVEFGAGFAAARKRGSENNDAFAVERGRVVTETNRCGGILGGISTGMPVVFRAAFKPTPSIAKEQRSVDLDAMQPATLRVTGRHDPCVVPRAVPVVEAAAAIAIYDALLRGREEGKDLQDYRREIDRIDAELTRLFAGRMAVSAQIAAYKREHGLGVLDASREREKLAAIEGTLPDALKPYGAALYRELFALSRSYQEALDARSVILIGMPGCGKTTLARETGEALGLPWYDCDALIEEKAGMSVSQAFDAWGENGFRALETAALIALSKRGRCVIATGGGCVTREENYAILHGCGTVVWLLRDLDKLPTDGRPISQSRDIRALYAEREPLYARFADARADNNGTVGETVERIKKIILI